MEKYKKEGVGMETEYGKKEIPKILIVDDISINVELMENIIAHEG